MDSSNASAELFEAWFPTAAGMFADAAEATRKSWLFYEKGDLPTEGLDRLELLPTKEREAMLRLRRRAETSARSVERDELEQGLARLRIWGSSVQWSSPDMLDIEDGSEAECWGDVSPRWRRLGFQSADPRRDLRTGILALDNLVYFCEQHSAEAEQMCAEASSESMGYPLAVASINLTQLLAWYLSLLVGPSPLNCESTIQPLNDQMQLHAFAKLAIDQDVFGELHSMAMIRLHVAWHEAIVADPTANVAFFSRGLHETLIIVDDVLRTSALESILDVRRVATR